MDTEDAKLVDMAIGECDRMKDFIKSLQDFNRPSSGTFTFVDIHATIDSLLLLCREEYNKKRLSLKLITLKIWCR